MCLYHFIFIHSSVEEHLGCFHILAIVNSAAINTGVCVEPWIELSGLENTLWFKKVWYKNMYFYIFFNKNVNIVFINNNNASKYYADSKYKKVWRVLANIWDYLDIIIKGQLVVPNKTRNSVAEAEQWQTAGAQVWTTVYMRTGCGQREDVTRYGVGKMTRENNLKFCFFLLPRVCAWQRLPQHSHSKCDP